MTESQDPIRRVTEIPDTVCGGRKRNPRGKGREIVWEFRLPTPTLPTTRVDWSLLGPGPKSVRLLDRHEIPGG